MIDLAALASARGETDAALKQWRAAAARARELADARPADAARRRLLGRALEQLAHAEAAAGEDPDASIAGAIEAFEKLPPDAATEEHIAGLRRFLREQAK